MNHYGIYNISDTIIKLLINSSVPLSAQKTRRQLQSVDEYLSLYKSFEKVDEQSPMMLSNPINPTLHHYNSEESTMTMEDVDKK